MAASRMYLSNEKLALGPSADYSRKVRAPIKKETRSQLLATVQMKNYEHELRKRHSDGKGYQKRPISHREYFAINGLLSPTGQLYACLYKQHAFLAEALGFQQLWKMEDAGWCSLQQMQWRVQSTYMTKPLTSQQRKTIKNWFHHNNFAIHTYLSLLEEAVGH